MRKQIIWTYWSHPLGGGEEYTDRTKQRPPRRNKNYYYEDGVAQHAPIRPVLATAAGVVPVNIYGDMCKVFDNWIAHADFTITDAMLERVAGVPGVETLDPISQYRFRVGIGLAFQGRGGEVRDAVNRVLGVATPRRGVLNPQGLIPDEAAERRVGEARAAAIASPYYAIYLLPNGVLETLTANAQDKHERQLAILRRCQATAGGIIYSNGRAVPNGGGGPGESEGGRQGDEPVREPDARAEA